MTSTATPSKVVMALPPPELPWTPRTPWHLPPTSILFSFAASRSQPDTFSFSEPARDASLPPSATKVECIGQNYYLLTTFASNWDILAHDGILKPIILNLLPVRMKGSPEILTKKDPNNYKISIKKSIMKKNFYFYSSQQFSSKDGQNFLTALCAEALT